MISAIIVRRVSKSFNKARQILDGVDLEIAEGEMVALIGASGSGKSTLIRLMAGFEQIDDGEGRIEILGQCVQTGGRRTPAQRRLRREIGIIFQQFNLIGRLPLLTNVLAGRLGRVPAWRGNLMIFRREDRIRALKCLERVGMVGHARQRASQLSGGQQQRGAIARALTQEARIILADEPIASLDPASADRVMEILGEINRKDRCTVLISLHQIDHAFRHCSRIIALKDGKIVFDGPTSGVSREDLAALYGLDPAHEEFSRHGGARPSAEPRRPTAPIRDTVGA
ncbi:MAG: phosphonate ABC transporter ATP-binding protein [Pikeienuella sp.]